MPRFPAKVNLINLPKKPKSLFSINRSPNTRVPTTVTADDCQISEPEVDPRIEISSHDHRDESPRSSIQTKKSNKIGHKRTSKEPREVILNQRQQQITNGLNYFYQLLTFSSRIMGAGLREDDDLLNDEDEASHDFEGFSKEVIHNHQLKLLEDEIVSSSEDDIDQHKSDTEVEGLLDSSPDITQSELDIQAISTVGEDAKSAQETLNLSPLVQKSSETTKKSRDLLVSQSPNTVLEKGAKTSSVQDDDEDHQTSIKDLNVDAIESQVIHAVSVAADKVDQKTEKEISGATREDEGRHHGLNENYAIPPSENGIVAKSDDGASSAIIPLKVKKSKDPKRREKIEELKARSLTSIQINWQERLAQHRNTRVSDVKYSSPDPKEELSVVVAPSRVTSPIGMNSPLTPSAQGLLMLAHPLTAFHLKPKRQKSKHSNKSSFPTPKIMSSLIGGRSGPRVKQVCRSTASGLPRATFSSQTSFDDDVFHENDTDSQATEREEDQDGSVTDSQMIRIEEKKTKKNVQTGKKRKRKNNVEKKKDSRSIKSVSKNVSPKKNNKSDETKKIKRKIKIEKDEEGYPLKKIKNFQKSKPEVKPSKKTTYSDPVAVSLPNKKKLVDRKSKTDMSLPSSSSSKRSR